MKYLKSFNESVKSKRDLSHSIIQFLIDNEKVLKVMFDDYTIERGEYHWEIVAKTKPDMKGNKPPMDEVRFPMEDFFTWLSKKPYTGDIYSKSNIFNIISSSNLYKKEPDEMDSKLLDTIFGQFSTWKICLSKIKIIREKISKYNIDDIDDRCLEYFDELTGWKPKFMLAYELCESTFRTLVEDDIYETWNLLAELNKIINKKTIEYRGPMSPRSSDLLTIISSHTKPCININFNVSHIEETYDYKEVKKVAVGIYNRLSKLYPIVDVKYDFEFYDKESYKNMSLPLSSYKLVLYLD